MGVAGAEIPSLDRARMDVYGTTGDDGDCPPGGGGGRGENSRSRSRYRRQAADVLEHRHRQRQRPNQQQQQQQGLVGDQCVNSSPAMPPLPPHNWHIAEAASQPRPRQQQHRISLHSIDHSRSPHHFRCMPTVHRPPPPHGEPAYSSTAIPVPGTTECAQLLTSIVHAAGMPADAANAMHAVSPPPATLRPGMRVFSRRGGLDVKSWYPGHVYSARVDPNNMAHAAAGRRGGASRSYITSGLTTAPRTRTSPRRTYRAARITTSCIVNGREREGSGRPGPRRRFIIRSSGRSRCGTSRGGRSAAPPASTIPIDGAMVGRNKGGQRANWICYSRRLRLRLRGRVLRI